MDHKADRFSIRYCHPSTWFQYHPWRLSCSLNIQSALTSGLSSTLKITMTPSGVVSVSIFKIIQKSSLPEALKIFANSGGIISVSCPCSDVVLICFSSDSLISFDPDFDNGIFVALSKNRTAKAQNRMKGSTNSFIFLSLIILNCGRNRQDWLKTSFSS